MKPIALMAALCASPALAQEQPICASRQGMVSTLLNGFDERLAGGGVRHDGQFLIEVYVSEAGTWTITLTGADGITCVLLVGTDWSFVTAKPGSLH